VSRPDLEPLSPELSRLLEVERTRPDPPPEMRSRVLEQIGKELLDLGVPGGGSPGAPPTASPPPSGAGVRAAGSFLRRIPLAVALLAVGGGGGAGLHAWLREPVRTTVYVPIPVASEAPAPAAPARPPSVAPSTPALTPSAPRSELRREQARRAAPSLPAPTPAPERESQLARDAALAAERALLEQARTALARGKPVDALAVLARHELDFPRGQLIEEREALQILSLARNRQFGAARARAALFRQAHPNSMLLRVIDAALATGS